MTSGQRTRSRQVYTVISLANEGRVPTICRQMQGTSDPWSDLRDQIFRNVARNSRFQRVVMQVLAKNPDIQHMLLMELARDLPFRRKLMVCAGQLRTSR